MDDPDRLVADAMFDKLSEKLLAGYTLKHAISEAGLDGLLDVSMAKRWLIQRGWTVEPLSAEKKNQMFFKRGWATDSDDDEEWYPIQDELKRVDSQGKAKAYVRKHCGLISTATDGKRYCFVIVGIRIGKESWTEYSHARCSDQDKFDVERGYDIAIGRAVGKLAERLLSKKWHNLFNELPDCPALATHPFDWNAIATDGNGTVWRSKNGSPWTVASL